MAARATLGFGAKLSGVIERFTQTSPGTRGLATTTATITRVLDANDRRMAVLLSAVRSVGAPSVQAPTVSAPPPLPAAPSGPLVVFENGAFQVTVPGGDAQQAEELAQTIVRVVDRSLRTGRLSKTVQEKNRRA